MRTEKMKTPRRDWLTPNEVAAMEGVQGQTVRWWILTGKLEGELAGPNTYLIHESALEQFRAERHNRNTQRATSGGRLSNRSAISKPLDPNKTYRIRSTGERVTGAELLRRRGES